MEPKLKGMSKRPYKKIRKVFVMAILLLAILLLASTLTEAIASHRAAGNYPPPGRLIEVNGTKLHFFKQGESGPVIVFESGYGAPSAYWNNIAERLSKEATVVTYDRAGYGWSDGTDSPRTGENIVDELHAGLAELNIKGPVILVSHSIGAQYSRLYAKKYPEEVKGLILVDPRSEEFGERTKPIFHEAGVDPEEAEAQPIGLYRFMKTSGLLRVFKNPILGGVYKTDKERDTAVNVFYTSKFFDSLENEPKEYQQLEKELMGQSLGNLPLTIISQSGKKWTPLPQLTERQNEKTADIWNEEQEKMARLSKNSRWIIAHKSGHDIAIDEPDLVIKEISGMMENISNK